MPSWKKVITSGSDAALNSLNVTAHFTASGLIYPATDGIDRQILKTDGLGNLSFDYAEEIVASVKNVSGTTLVKGTPVHATQSGTMGNAVGIIAASASDATTMPATFVLNETLADGAEGYALASGFIQGVNTSAFTVGDIVYVGANGGYTNVKPTGSNRIQNLGIVTKIDAVNGSGFVLGSGRANDIPNINPGYVWVGNNDWVATAIATSSIQNVVSSSFAATASYVNTLNQSVLITGSAAIGTSSLGPFENTLTLGARDNTSEGGQIGFNAPGGSYTSASFIDNWQNKARILKGNNTTSTGLIAQWDIHTTQLQLPAYTAASSFPGTATANLAVDSSGNVITVSTSGGTVFPYTGNAVITGSLTTTGIIYAQPNGGMYFQGGDDAALYDINVSNHMGIYGVQDSTVGAIKLGSNGAVLYSSGSKFGINTTNPSSASLTVNGNVWATSFTGSLLGTASYATTALSASYAPAVNPFPYNGNAQISGSLGVTGSFTTQTWNGASYVSALSFTDVSRGIFDVPGVDSIDADSRDLFDSSAVNSISWEYRRLFDTSTSRSIDWETRYLHDNAGTITADWNSALLYDTTGLNSIDWKNRETYDSAQSQSIAWAERRLLDNSAVPSIRWGLRYAIDAVASQSIAWDARLLKIDNGPASYTVNWGSGILRDTSGKNSVDWENRFLKDSSAVNVLDYRNSQLLFGPLGNTVLDWQTQLMYDTSTSASIDWNNRTLSDTSTSASIDWNNRTLSDANEGDSIDWDGRATYDSANGVSIDWEARALYDSTNVSSIDWNSRTLIDSGNNSVLAYDPTANDGKTVQYSYHEYRINDTQGEDLIAAAVNGSMLNSAGEVISYGTNIDPTTVIGELCSLGEDGIWYTTDQASISGSAMLSICLIGYNKGVMMTEGTITVVTASGYTDIPFVEGTSFYGKPVYMRSGSLGGLTTITPTSGYVRVVGHMYYNSTTYTDYWLMKFRPSNDWYVI